MGRRSLLLLGFGGMFVFYALMTIAFRYEVRHCSNSSKNCILEPLTQ